MLDIIFVSVYTICMMIDKTLETFITLSKDKYGGYAYATGTLQTILRMLLEGTIDNDVAKATLVNMISELEKK